MKNFLYFSRLFLLLHISSIIIFISDKKSERGFNMDIKQETNGTELTMFLSGRLDTVAAVDFEKALDAVSKDVTLLIVDCAELSYVASSGLRMFLRAQKRMNAQGKLVVRHVQESVMEVFSMTGFDSLLRIEN